MTSEDKDKLGKEINSMLVGLNKDNLPRLYDAAVQGSVKWSAVLVAEVFGLFVVFALTEPLTSPSDHMASVRDSLLFAVSIVVLASGFVTLERLWRQNTIKRWISYEIEGMYSDSHELARMVYKESKKSFPAIAQVSQFFARSKWGVRVGIVLGIFVFVLTWIAVLL